MWCTSRSTPRRTSTTNGCLPLSITTDPKVSHGGLRYPVETLLELLASDMTFDEVLRTTQTESATTCSRHLSSVPSPQAAGGSTHPGPREVPD
jgi:hypothetical protein